MWLREFQRKLNTARGELVSRVVKLVPATSFVVMTSQLISLLDHYSPVCKRGDGATGWSGRAKRRCIINKKKPNVWS